MSTQIQGNTSRDTSSKNSLEPYSLVEHDRDVVHLDHRFDCFVDRDE